MNKLVEQFLKESGYGDDRLDYSKETRKIDKIISRIQAKIDRNGAYENAGQREYREYMDSLDFGDYSTRSRLSDYFQDKLENLGY